MGNKESLPFGALWVDTFRTFCLVRLSQTGKDKYCMMSLICEVEWASFFLDFIYLFLERVREGEREGNVNVWLPLEHPLLGTWPTTQACALIGTGTSNPLVLRSALNPLSHISQG